MTPVVLLHGWGMGSAVFDDLAGRLSARRPIRALDLAGYGAQPASEPYTLEQLANDVALRAPEKCLVAGWSLGAQVAIKWARARPQQVERLALIGATPCFAQRKNWDAGVQARVLRAFGAALRSDCCGTLTRFISLQARGDDAAKRVVRRLRASLASGGMPRAQTLEHGLDLLLESDLRDVLAGVEQPALVVHGESDKLAPLAAAEYLAQALPRARLAVLRGAAHAPFISDATTVSRLMLEFFDER